jgi:four helix bundle protein
MAIQSFEELRIWQQGAAITEEIYRETNNPLFSKDYSLKDQIRRSLISITSNIAEGFERNNNNEFRRFLSYSKGSAGEARSQLYMAWRFEYIGEVKYLDYKMKLVNLSKQISALIKYIEKYKKTGEDTQ